MRIYISLFMLLLWSAAFSQNNNTISLQWSDANYQISSSTAFLLPQFQIDNFSYNSADKTILYRNTYKDNALSNEKSLQVSNIQYQTIDINKYRNLDKNNIPSTLNATVISNKSRGQIYTTLSFNPIIREGSTYKKVISLTYSYTYNNIQSRAVANIARTNSVLSSGDWYKFKIGETGIYKIDKNFLVRLGIPANVDPRTIKIYGQGGKMLPLKNSDNTVFDLPEIAIQISGESDGQFNDSDYILFYGIGTKGWDPVHASHNNLYDDNSYYYITYGNGNGKRVTTMNQPNAGATVNYSSFDERVFHEQDLVNIAQLSRKWFGETFAATNQRTINLSLDQIDTAVPVRVEINAAASSVEVSSLAVNLNNQNIGTIELAKKDAFSVAAERFFRYETTLSSATANISLAFNNNGIPSAVGYLDFVAIEYTKQLRGYGKQFGFRVKDAATQVGVANYTISNASSIAQVWDVTDPYNAQNIANTSANLTFKAQLGEVKEYRAIDMSNLFTPEVITNSRVTNQNLKGNIFNDGDVDYLIICPDFLVTSANKLANFHRTSSNLNTKVVPLSLIYEEFSSGKQDVAAIRNFIRYVYMNASSENSRVKYVNLFGDGSHDYKNRIQNNTNVVPVFQAMDNNLNHNDTRRFNFNDQICYMTDDFYGLMDDNEGQLTNNQNYTGVDIALGRMLLSTVEQANNAVDKVVQYHQKDNSGRWKNVYLALADDVDALSDVNLQVTLEEMVTKLVEAKGAFNVRKVYTDSYVQEVVSGGPRYPKAKEDFLNAFNSGALMINYLGHGGINGLAAERLLEMYDIDNLANTGKYPLFAIVTCEYTQFDKVTEISGGQRLFLKKDAGVISLLATTRKIGIGNAENFTKRVSEYLFNIDGISSDNLTISEALRLTKNSYASNEKAVVFYIGDPALKLGIPKPKVELTHVNGSLVQDFTGSLRALDLVKIGGSVTDASGSLMSGFNGELAIQIFDKEIERTTLGNDGVTNGQGLITMDFKTLGETIFRGNATVTNGKFEIEFVVPKDIKIAIGEGKASFYAVKEGQILDDYTGYNNVLKIGGVNENAAEDNKAPQMKLYMNDESFISGNVTNESPLFLAYLEDENGINTASGIGHDMVAILDGDDNNPYVMNDYYETEPNNFRKGIVKFPFKDLEDGLHTLTFKAWDVYNNLATSEIQFIVAKNENITLEKVLNYPNPFVDYTEFWFQHNRPSETLQVQVQILTITGKIVKTINQTIVTEGNLSREIIWNGRDDFGDKIGKGVYIYKLKVKSLATGHQAEKIEKLVIL